MTGSLIELTTSDNIYRFYKETSLHAFKMFKFYIILTH